MFMYLYLYMSVYVHGPEMYTYSYTYTCVFTEGGHPQFKSLPRQLRNIADNQIDCGFAD